MPFHYGFKSKTNIVFYNMSVTPAWKVSELLSYAMNFDISTMSAKSEGYGC